MLQKHTERLGNAPLGSLIVKLSLPGIAAMMAGSMYIIVNTFWVARLGHKAIYCYPSFSLSRIPKEEEHGLMKYIQ